LALWKIECKESISVSSTSLISGSSRPTYGSPSKQPEVAGPSVSAPTNYDLQM
tara:strand:- start:409 stop:567 length:159 start_codon:yes stop_codon:yes gene_type:complete